MEKQKLISEIKCDNLRLLAEIRAIEYGEDEEMSNYITNISWAKTPEDERFWDGVFNGAITSIDRKNLNVAIKMLATNKRLFTDVARTQEKTITNKNSSIDSLESIIKLLEEDKKC